MAETLNREQVLAKAKELGIVHDKRASTKNILKMINDLTGEEHTLEEQKQTKLDGFTKCIIHSNDRENDEPEMTVGLNGEIVQIQIGEEVTLDNKFIGVIRDAVIERHVPVLDKDGEPTGKNKIRKEPRYIIETVG